MTLSIRRRLRSPIIGLVAVATVLLAPGVANAAPPSNDDFDTATTISALPFTSTMDTTQATKASDDPISCYYSGSGSEWFDYTAPADGIVMASATTAGTRPLISAYTGARGALTQVPGSCTNGNRSPLSTFHVTAGTTYHIMLIDPYYGSQVTFGLTAVPVEPNDAFATATVAAFPSELTGDLSRSSAEPGETTPSCDSTVDHSVWYRYTPERTRSVSVERAAYNQAPAISVYRGTRLDGLTEVDCVPSQSYLNSVFTATAGQTYYIRVAAGVEDAGWFDVRIGNAPALKPYVSFYPQQPSVYDTITFSPWAGDPLGRPLVSGEVRFGDGAAAPIDGSPIQHQYTKDGQYQVEVTGATGDGRAGSTVDTVRVETHDVALSDLRVPASARVDQTKSIKVSVGNTRYDEDVRVELFRLSEGGYYTSVGVLTQRVVAAPGHQVDFPFAYTYTAADAAAGKVTFKVAATLSSWSSGDDHPQDNELVGVTTSVRPKA
ncbi:PKD domain-containing protein [Kutzneria sp. CA-103260]|uniref:PKD domain-containing protein n=1 Tax=Kutzneria sp. CA-103260 TaxID=2802641 RepID=UPI001BAA0C25|nr:PKD domain-containing protein [Kutzneria sp. CA-103260]QUQ68695.1 hypothetical protein JJ691_64420 [Kutzneria sp. CA-103260]